MKQKTIVALVGRPNVGKSTLFNRLVGRRLAIVEDLAGTTRDRLYAEADWAGRTFLVVDTGGLELGYEQSSAGGPPPASGHNTGVESGLFLPEIIGQTKEAIAGADVIVFITDVQTGMLSTDLDVVDVLRRSDKPIILAVNKCDNAATRAEAVEFFGLGLGDPFPISAQHGQGTGDLLDAIVAAFPPSEEEPEEDERLHIAIVGKPNAGKSSMLNRLLGQERVIVSEIPGTTRDAIDSEITYEGQSIVLIDTAGIRRRGKIESGVEKFSVLRALKAINRADVCLLMLDATSFLTAQDAHIAGYILDEEKSVVVVVNKWDAIEKDERTMEDFNARIRTDLRFLDYVPILYVSAKSGQRVNTIIPMALKVQEERMRRISTADMMRMLEEATAHFYPPSHKGRQLRFFYATQPAVNPPTFVFFVNDKELVHFSYQRYLENKLRERFGFLGTPLKLIFRSREPRATRP